MTEQEGDKMRRQQKQMKQLSQKQIDKFQEIHRAVQAVADHFQRQPRPR